MAAHRRGKVAVLEGGGLPALAALLTAPFASVRQMAAGAVLSVAVEQDAKLAVAQVAGAQLGAMVADPLPGVALDAARALHSAAELPAARAALFRALDRAALATVFPDEARGEPPVELQRRTYLNLEGGGRDTVSAGGRMGGLPPPAGGTGNGGKGIGGGRRGGGGGGLLAAEPSARGAGLEDEDDDY